MLQVRFPIINYPTSKSHILVFINLLGQPVIKYFVTNWLSNCQDYWSNSAEVAASLGQSIFVPWHFTDNAVYDFQVSHLPPQLGHLLLEVPQQQVVLLLPHKLLGLPLPLLLQAAIRCLHFDNQDIVTLEVVVMRTLGTSRCWGEEWPARGGDDTWLLPRRESRAGHDEGEERARSAQDSV